MKVMSKALYFLLTGALLATVTAGTVCAQEDVAGSKDHPLFNRLPNYRISYYNDSEFDVYKKIRDSKGKKITVEGRYIRIDYRIKKDMKNKALSSIAIIRNYTNAFKKIGGDVLREERGNAYMKLEKDGQRIWVHVRTGLGGKLYSLNIIEAQKMKQVIVANAKSMAQDISNTGRVALYGIYFDTDKSEVKPESAPALKEIANLLQEEKELKLYVVGHTDNVGDFDYNMKLSRARADAVVKSLVSEYGADANRLKPAGVGPLSPVTANKTEDGRAKNRRVELVEQ
jgi:OOP family OmpA-OmpF porin